MMKIPLVLGSQFRKNYNLIKRIQRYNSLQRMDLGQNFHKSAEQSKTYPKHVETYTTPQQNFTELCRSPVM
jgi:superfamily II RNA helicase